MKKTFKIEGAYYPPHIGEKMQAFLNKNIGKNALIELRTVRNIRSIQQNKALHLWFDQIAYAMRDKGMESYFTIGNKKMRREITPIQVKYNIFHQIMKAETGKDSTKKLTTKELCTCAQILIDNCFPMWDICVHFPSEKELQFKLKYNL